MNRKLLFIIIVILVGILGYIWFVNSHKSGRTGENASTPSQTESSIEYTNNKHGFSFSLPQSWKNYSIVTSAWEGYTAGPKGDVPAENGPLISIRNPKWTAKNPYQDIPIMIFTLAQWDSLMRDEFHIGVAPINPTRLGFNANYVFALPARYNFAFPAGSEEVEKILQSNPLQPLISSSPIYND